jgi:signal transduction histidine kinase
MTTFWALPLRRQLLLTNLLLCLGPVLVLAIWSSAASLREREEDLRKQANTVASTTVTYINRDLQYLDGLAQQLADAPEVRALDGAKASAMLQQVILARQSIVGVVVTAEGRVIARAVRPGALLENPSWPADPIQQPVRRIEPAGADASHPARYVVVGYPVRGSDQQPGGTLTLYIDVARLHRALEALPLPLNSVVLVSDEQGRVIAQNVPDEKNAVDMLYGADGRGSHATTLTGGDDVKRLRVEATVDAGPWHISVGVPRDVSFAVALWQPSSAVLVAGLIGCFLGAWFLSRRLGGSVGHLHAAAQRIGAGDFSPLPTKPMRSAEFADLQAAFNSMLKQFNSTRAALDAQMAEERRIRQELESLQGQVIRQERLAAVGQLVSGVAHEINNPLQAILGFAELLQMQRDVPVSVKSDLRLIQKESARACAIIRNLALFARQQPGEATPLTMSDVIRSVAELRQRRLESEDIELRIEDRATRSVRAVLTELQQVVLNFVVNAEQAILASGRLPGRITLRTYDRDDQVVFEVEDTGPGIAEENEAKLFQPFFTTKPVGQGTGLGLSISYGIIDSLGGNIGYRNAAVGGAIFYFDLPATADDFAHQSSAGVFRRV